MQKQKVKIGLIGAGRIGKIHAENLLRIPGAELAAVSELYADDKLRDWATARGIGTVTTDSFALLDDPEIDAIVICSTTDTHIPLITAAAQAGKHIFCEKPVSMDIRQTAKALELVRETGVTLQIGFNRRFDHNFKQVREHVRSGAVGEPHVVKITSRDPGAPPEAYIRVSGGLFMDMAIHDFDMARFMVGSEVEEVFAVGSVLVDPVFARCDDVDTAVITLKFANGALGVIDNSRSAAYGYDQRVEVFGSKGASAATNDYPNNVVLSTAERVSSEKPLHFFLERYNAAYYEEMEKFIACLLHGGECAVDLADALQAERIALAAKLSSKLGRTIRLADLEDIAHEAGEFPD